MVWELLVLHTGMGQRRPGDLQLPPVSLASAGVFREYWCSGTSETETTDRFQVHVNPCSLLSNRRKIPLSRSVECSQPSNVGLCAFWFAYICLKQKFTFRAVRGSLGTILVIVQKSCVPHVLFREKIIYWRCECGYFLLFTLVASCLPQNTMGTELGCLDLAMLLHFKWLWNKWVGNANFLNILNSCHRFSSYLWKNSLNVCTILILVW